MKNDKLEAINPMSIKNRSSHKTSDKCTIASTELGCAGRDHHRVFTAKPDGFPVHFRPGIVHFHTCPSPQTVPFRVPPNNLVLDRRSEVHAVHHLPGNRRSEDTAAVERATLGGLLVAALVEALHGGVPERARGVVADEDLESELNVVVFDSGVLVPVGEPEGEEDGGVSGRGI